MQKDHLFVSVLFINTFVFNLVNCISISNPFNLLGSAFEMSQFLGNGCHFHIDRPSEPSDSEKNFIITVIE